MSEKKKKTAVIETDSMPIDNTTENDSISQQNIEQTVTETKKSKIKEPELDNNVNAIDESDDISLADNFHDKLKEELDSVLKSNAKNKSKVPSEDFNPYKESVIKNTPDDNPEQTTDFQEDTVKKNISSPQFSDIPAEEETVNTATPEDTAPVETSEAEPPSKESIEATADAILTAAGEVVPVPFLMLSQISKKKASVMHKSGEIDLDMLLIPEQKYSVKNDIDNYNKVCEDNLKFTDNDKKLLKPPLVRLLQEKNVAMSPTMELMMMGGIVIMGKIKIVTQLVQMRNESLDTYKEMQQRRYVHETKIVQPEAKENVNQQQQEEDVITPEIVRPKKSKKVTSVNDYLETATKEE